MPASRPCPRCKEPLPVNAAACPACGCPVHQRTLIGVAAIQAIPRAPAPVDAADETVLGPPSPLAPSWAQIPMAAPTLLDSQPPFRAVTPAGGHPALPPTADRPEDDGAARAVATDHRAADRTMIDAAPRRGPRTIAADQMHRAVAETRAHAASHRRGRRATRLMIVLALGAVATAAVLYTTRFRAELADAFEVTRTSSGYAVAAALRTSGPAVVQHPGGATPFDGAAELRFEMPASALQLGDNPVALTVVAEDGATRALTLHVMVYYHRASPSLVAPRRGTPVHLDLEVQPGWTATLKAAGTVTLVDATHLRLSVLPDDAMRAARPGATVVLPIPFELRAPDGATHAFTERLHLPPGGAAAQ